MSMNKVKGYSLHLRRIIDLPIPLRFVITSGQFSLCIRLTTQLVLFYLPFQWHKILHSPLLRHLPIALAYDPHDLHLLI